MEEYEFDNFFENDAALAYSIAAAFAAEKGITQVYDIGSAMAAQSELFESVGVSYVAVESHVPSYMHATHVIPQKYPCNLPAFDRTKTMGISRLCVGYLAQDDKTYICRYTIISSTCCYLRRQNASLKCMNSMAIFFRLKYRGEIYEGTIIRTIGSILRENLSWNLSCKQLYWQYKRPSQGRLLLPPFV